MKHPYWKPQHEVFIRCMLRHGDATKAYRTAYPKASGPSARVGGIRLNGYPHIRQCIQPILDQRRETADRLAMQEGRARTKAQILRGYHIRGVLCAMARGKMKKDRRFIVNGQTITMQEDILHATVLHLISLDLKLAAGYENWNSIERQFAKLTANVSETRSMVSPSGGQGVNRQQTVINSPANPIPTQLPVNPPKPGNHPKTDNKTATDNKFSGLERYFNTSPLSYLTHKENLGNDHTFYVKKQ